MSAVAAATVSNGNHDVGRDPSIEQSPSRFTAVNGRDQHSMSNGSPDSHLSLSRENSTDSRRGSEHSRNNQLTPNDRPMNHHDQLESHPNSDSHSAGSNRNKRKRSDSSDRQASPCTSTNSHSAPRSPHSKTDENMVPQPHLGEPNGIGRPTMTPESDLDSESFQQHGSADSLDNEPMSASHHPPWNGHHTSPPNQPRQLILPMDASDTQVAEALQRDLHGSENAAKAWEHPSAGGRQIENSGPKHVQLAPYIQQQQPEMPNKPLVQIQPHIQPQISQQPHIQPQAPSQSKSHSQSQGQAQNQSSTNGQPGPKRKRVFSNRTKTGCMTCRRRKKKCDEQHPACNNCIRGNFPCEGYSVRSTWQKPSNPKGPVPLQSKSSYPDVPHSYPPHEMSPQRHDARVNTAMIPEGGKNRPVPVDEADRGSSQYIGSPPGTGARNSWPPKASWTTQGPAGYHPDGPPKPEFRDNSALKEIPPRGGEQQGKAEYAMVHTSEIPHNTHSKQPPGTMTVFQQAPPIEPRSGGRIDPANYTAQARMALNMEQHITFEPSTKSEKEKMLTGEQYKPYDPQIVKDRERCKAAIWRFTNAGNPMYGISLTERLRLLKDILMPSLEGLPESLASHPMGSLGPGAVVEAPFNCHFGYNINIGEDVQISENCFFADDCTINIGAHTWIGPGVTILSSMAIGSMQERKGSQSRYQGRPVVIAEDCWIGAGCTILPGVTLGRGAYIAPGEVVRSQILPYGFQGLKPNYP